MERLTYFDNGRWMLLINGVEYAGLPFVDRLAAYEDTMSIERAQELSQAEKDGRLMVLPCKRGDTLWSLYNYPTKGICEVVVTAVSTLDGVTAINTNNFSVLSEEDVGKTVFLTRKEAEAALKKRVEEDDETVR